MTNRRITQEKTPEARALWTAVINRKEDEVRKLIQQILQDILRSEEPYDCIYSWAKRLQILVDHGNSVT